MGQVERAMKKMQRLEWNAVPHQMWILFYSACKQITLLTLKMEKQLFLLRNRAPNRIQG